MKQEIITVETSGYPSSYQIAVGESLLTVGRYAREATGDSATKALIVSNKRVYDLYGAIVEASLITAGFKVSNVLIGDGERYKSLKTAETVLRSFAVAKLSRTDLVVALGGGVVGDLAGFAAAVYLRGIRFVQVPTTLLSMIDSSVGGKTGVNSAFGKNLIGAFHQPSAVVVDPGVLMTLAEREVTAGLCEVVKHAALSGGELYEITFSLLRTYSDQKHQRSTGDSTFRERLTDLIAANIRFKAQIVAGDEREEATRSDGASRKILNFGHTLGHALEKVTKYRYFKHGEAVGYGILFAAELSKSLALLDNDSVNSLNDVVSRVGRLPPLAGIDGDEVFEAFKFDKKQLAGSLQMILLKNIGEPMVLTDSEIPEITFKKVLKTLLQKWA